MATSGTFTATTQGTLTRSRVVHSISPEFSPIKLARATVKEQLKAKAARSLEVLEVELKPALETITAKDAQAGSGTPAVLYTDPDNVLATDELKLDCHHSKKSHVGMDGRGKFMRLRRNSVGIL
jgi:hypothetical protein